jgi:hypothetical protein
MQFTMTRLSGETDIDTLVTMEPARNVVPSRQRMTWAEIEAAYPDQWVVIGELELDPESWARARLAASPWSRRVRSMVKPALTIGPASVA